MTVLCVGCGRPLPQRSARGRPARYHGPACRQRARRARRGADPGAAALLAVAARAEQAALALRRAVATGQDHDAAAAELLAAATALAAMRDGSDEPPPSGERGSGIQRGPLPGSVTDAAAPPPCPSAESHRLPAGPAQRSGDGVTKSVTKPMAQRHTAPRRPQLIDPDTVRLERSADYDLSGAWRVLAGPADDPIVVGSVCRTGLGKQWQARTPELVELSGGPWRTRQDALVHLVLAHQQAAASPSDKRRPR